MTRTDAWHVRIWVRRPSPEAASRLAVTIAPEATRDVPRATVLVRLVDRTGLEIRIAAADTGACRAALNTYLAWVALVLSTERAAVSRSAGRTTET